MIQPCQQTPAGCPVARQSPRSPSCLARRRPWLHPEPLFVGYVAFSVGLWSPPGHRQFLASKRGKREAFSTSKPLFWAGRLERLPGFPALPGEGFNSSLRLQAACQGQLAELPLLCKSIRGSRLALGARLDPRPSWKHRLSSPRLGRTARAGQERPFALPCLRQKARFLGGREDELQRLRLDRRSAKEVSQNVKAVDDAFQ